MSSFTSFLKLFKWNPKTDGSEKFNIDKALNENLDKIEANAKSVNNAIGSLSSLSTTDKTSLVNALNELRLQTRVPLNGGNVQYSALLTDRTFDEIMQLDYPSVFTIDGNATTVNGAGFPTGAYAYGTLITFRSASNYARAQIYITDSPYSRGIYFRTRVSGSWLKIGGNISINTEFVTSEYLDGKQVYRKRLSIGALPNTTTKSVKHGLTNVTFIRLQGVATNDSGTTIPLPFASPAAESIVSLSVNNTNININTGMDRSNYAGYVDLYYTKN